MATANSQEADRNKRIFHPDYFHRYFIWDVQSSLYGEQELQRLVERLNATSDNEGLKKVLADEIVTLDKVPARRADFFDRLAAASDTLKPHVMETLAYWVGEHSSGLEPEFLGLGEEARGRASCIRCGESLHQQQQGRRDIGEGDPRGCVGRLRI